MADRHRDERRPRSRLRSRSPRRAYSPRHARRPEGSPRHAHKDDDRGRDRRLRSRSRSRSDGAEKRHSRSRSRRRSRSPDRSRRSRSPDRSRSRSPVRKRRRSRSRSGSRTRHGESRKSRSRSRDRGARRKRSRDRDRSASSSSGSEDDSRRRKERRKEGKRRKEKKREKKERKEKKKQTGPQWGKYGIISELDLFTKGPEFHTWLVEERKINPETISKEQNKKEFMRYVEDFNTATLPHEKYYHMEAYERRMSALRQGEFIPPQDDTYDPQADMKAISGAHKKKVVEHDSYLSKEQLQDLRRVQQERIEAGKMKLLGMDVKQNMGVRMDGTVFDG